METWLDAHGWNISRGVGGQGFIEILWALLQELGFQQRPRYVGKEHAGDGIERCYAYVVISGPGPLQAECPISVEGYGKNFLEATQAVAKLAIQELGSRFTHLLGNTAAKYLPIGASDNDVWNARIQALQEPQHEDYNPRLATAVQFMGAQDYLYERRDEQT